MKRILFTSPPIPVIDSDKIYSAYIQIQGAIDSNGKLSMSGEIVHTSRFYKKGFRGFNNKETFEWREK